MLQHQPKKFLALEGAVSGLTGCTVEVLEGHFAMVIGNDVVFIDHTPIQVTGQVLQCGCTFTDMPAIDHPPIG